MASPSQVTEYQTGFAPQIAPYAEKLLGDAQSLTDTATNPYMQYQGERNAQFSPLQRQSYDNAALMRSSPQLQDATAMAGLAGLGALNTQYTYDPYKSGSITDQTISTMDVDANGNPTHGGGSVLQNYMNPYREQVTDVQKLNAQRQAAVANQGQQAQAARSGMFGGSGQARQASQSAADLQRNLQGIDAAGLQNAYTQALGQFNTEQGQKLGAAQLNAQQGQFGAGLGLQGLQTSLQAAQGLGQLGQQQYQQNMGINALQNQYGLQQQAQVQKDLDTKYQDYTNAQNYPYKQLSFMSDIIRGAPLTQTGSSVYQAPPSTTQNIASLGLGAAGISKMFGSADGGLTRAMADGGMAYANGGGIGALALNHLV
jgi:hypothetical protein